MTQVLEKSRTPLTRGELAAEALKAGHRTSSKNYANVIGVEINQMDNIERVAGEGYRLRKGKNISQGQVGVPLFACRSGGVHSPNRFEPFADGDGRW